MHLNRIGERNGEKEVADVSWRRVFFNGRFQI